MTGDDLGDLILPTDARSVLKQPREAWVAEHAINVRSRWWNAALDEFQMPGGRIDSARLTRRDVWSLASGASDPDGAFRLLWHALAWGAGNKLRQNRKRLASIALDVDGVGVALVDAGRLSLTDPAAAYRVLRPGRTNLVKSLGPNFFTKYLYFAGGGSANHRALILDSQVAGALRDRCGWTSLHQMGPWRPDTYGRYCDLLTRWAQEASTSERPVAGDELERWLFSLGPRSEA